MLHKINSGSGVIARCGGLLMQLQHENSAAFRGCNSAAIVPDGAHSIFHFDLFPIRIIQDILGAIINQAEVKVTD